uniref:Pept_C1 domain-containing protein n=1 Tax=Macrostomum lignano TaxID=282301 RepID=A0A1I8FAH5_9PLAT
MKKGLRLTRCSNRAMLATARRCSPTSPRRSSAAATVAQMGPEPPPRGGRRAHPGRSATSFDWREIGRPAGPSAPPATLRASGSSARRSWSICPRQQLVDCDKVDEGCNGGLPSQAYKEIERMGGLMKGGQRPEVPVPTRGKVAVYINSSVAISKDEKAMARLAGAERARSSIGHQRQRHAVLPERHFASLENLLQPEPPGPRSPYCWIWHEGHRAVLDHQELLGHQLGPTRATTLVYRGDGTCGLNQMCTSAQMKQSRSRRYQKADGGASSGGGLRMSWQPP